MAHEILSVKLCELDQAIGRMQSRIHLSESAKPSQLQAEIDALSRECAETDLSLRKTLQLSRASIVSVLAQAYDEIEASIQSAADKLQTVNAESEEISASENQLLLAEYALDFAMAAANHALLCSLTAINTQLSQQAQEGGTPT